MKNPLVTQDLSIVSTNIKSLVAGHPQDTGGLLRFSPTLGLARMHLR